MEKESRREKKDDKKGTDGGICEELKAAEGSWGERREQRADGKRLHMKSQTRESNKANRVRREGTGRVGWVSSLPHS